MGLKLKMEKRLNMNETVKKAVVITGCSSGIGRAAALFLAQQGWVVFATVRREADAEALRSSHLDGLIPVCPLDLTRLEQINAAVDLIKGELDRRGIAGLSGVVNNAGGGGVAPIEAMDLEIFRTELQTRLWGPVALLQATLPLVRTAQGRVIWIVTPSLMPVPYVASIHACDFAANCLARTLQLELKPWGIPCIQIRCGGIDTPAASRTQTEMNRELQQPDSRLALYRDALEKEMASLRQFDQQRSAPEEVAKKVFQALTERRPRARYRVGYLSGLAAAVELLPQPWMDWVLAKREK
jgi:NAD(P)-dependent dehydrogenase (short-subunit alcohol dehydrogenase family)